jgi:hypothetical protein
MDVPDCPRFLGCAGPLPENDVRIAATAKR